MRRQLDTPDARIAAVAEEQGGVIGLPQLLACGLSPSGVDRRVRRGWLHRLHRGVFAVGHRRIGALGRRMAAVLAVGEGAVLVHRTALDAWDVRRTTSGVVHVGVPTGGGRARRRGLVVHRLAALRPEDTTTLGPLPITTAERTLLDVAASLRLADLVRAIEQAEKLRIVDFAVLEALARRPVPGAPRLREALGTPTDNTRSRLERDFLALCRDAGLPEPLVNHPVGPFIVDALWPDHRLVVEIDSRMHHHTRAAFERDRRRDAELMAQGYRVVRFTDRRLAAEPVAVQATLRAVMAQPPPAATPWR
jgi:hypothetical protein